MPENRDLASAERWIAGDAVRRQRWLSLDLVVERDGAVAGEVGLSAFDREAHAAQIGWWTTADHRGRGVASAAAAALASWALRDLGLGRIVARCPSRHPASVAVARAAGFEVITADGEGMVVLEAT